MLLRIVTLATLAMAKAAFKLQLARNQTALHQAAISAVSRMLNFSSGGSATIVPSSTAWTVVVCDPYDRVLRGLRPASSSCGNGLYPLTVSFAHPDHSWTHTERPHSDGYRDGSASTQLG